MGLCFFCDCDAATTLGRALPDGGLVLIPCCQSCADLRLLFAFAARTDSFPGIN